MMFFQQNVNIFWWTMTNWLTDKVYRSNLLNLALLFIISNLHVRFLLIITSLSSSNVVRTSKPPPYRLSLLIRGRTQEPLSVFNDRFTGNRLPYQHTNRISSSFVQNIFPNVPPPSFLFNLFQGFTRIEHIVIPAHHLRSILSLPYKDEMDLSISAYTI